MMTSNAMLNENLIAALAVGGVQFRGYRGESDLPHMLAVINGAKAVDGDERSETLEEITWNYAHLTNCDPHRDVILAEADSQVVGYSRVTWWDENGGDWIYLHFGFVLPAWRGKGIGSAMLSFCQERLRQIAAEQIEHGKRSANAPAYFQSDAVNSDLATTRLLEEHGFQPVRYHYTMLRPNLENIPKASLPRGIEVRPVDWQAHKRQIFEAEIEAFRDHWGFSEPDENDYADFVAYVEQDPNIDPALWRVAWQGDQVVGMVRSFINPNENREYNRLRGWTEHISVRKPWRKQGVATALINLSLQALKEKGMREAALGVDTQNTSGALRVYERAGFRPIKTYTTYRKRMD